ncbi:11868_t:CDS:2 [Dentiscutata erythropus]|uniref:RecQ-mediated genome instability protein 1 n=1 Tax=Dentiscutata erythropus TaxID=1348616 RepID=A0A9N9EVF3_9GLOM|nr:11868_t:CDS:2 [Dentiscutata erythropus]
MSALFVKNRFKVADSIQLQDAWLQQCLDKLQSKLEYQNANNQKLYQAVYNEFLDSDLKYSMKPHLPPFIDNTHKIIIGEHYPVTLQVVEIFEVGIPNQTLFDIINSHLSGSIKQGHKYNDIRDKKIEAIQFPREMLRLYLTDGTQIIDAMELKPVLQLNLLTPIGTKISVKNTLILRGVLCLESQKVTILGGFKGESRSIYNIRNQLEYRLGLPVTKYSLEDKQTPEDSSISEENQRISLNDNSDISTSGFTRLTITDNIDNIEEFDSINDEVFTRNCEMVLPMSTNNMENEEKANEVKQNITLEVEQTAQQVGKIVQDGLKQTGEVIQENSDYVSNGHKLNELDSNTEIIEIIEDTDDLYAMDIEYDSSFMNFQDESEREDKNLLVGMENKSFKVHSSNIKNNDLDDDMEKGSKHTLEEEEFPPINEPIGKKRRPNSFMDKLSPAGIEQLQISPPRKSFQSSSPTSSPPIIISSFDYPRSLCGSISPISLTTFDDKSDLINKIDVISPTKTTNYSNDCIVISDDEEEKDKNKKKSEIAKKIVLDTINEVINEREEASEIATLDTINEEQMRKTYEIAKKIALDNLMPENIKADFYQR